MSNMFVNYDNINKLYQPNNMSNMTKAKCITKLPYEEYNTKGELIGYYWYYGDTVNLEFDIYGELTVMANSIIYKASGEEPTTTTIGTIGQQAYNIIDYKSWTCTSIENNKYTWTLNDKYLSDESIDIEESPQNIYITAKDFLADKQLILTFYNFRGENIYQQMFNGVSPLTVAIDEKTSKEVFQKGIYYISLIATNKNNTINITIIDQPDYIINVK